MRLPSRLKSHLPEIARELNPVVESALRLGAEAVAEAAKSRAPVSPGGGALRDSIHVDRRADGEYAVVAGDGDVFYGHLVEFGTTHSSARPFLVPAVEATQRRVLDDIRDALRVKL